MVTKKRNPEDLCIWRHSNSVVYLLMVLWSDLVLARTEATRLTSSLDVCSLNARSLHDWDLCAQR